MAGLCAFLCPGLGHLILGKPIQAFVWFVVIVAGYLCFIVPGIIVHILSILDAAKLGRRETVRTISEAMRRTR